MNLDEQSIDWAELRRQQNDLAVIQFFINTNANGVTLSKSLRSIREGKVLWSIL